MVLPVRHLLALSKIRRLSLCLVVLAVAVLHAPIAAAVETIPGNMRDVMGLECTPTCLLCHTRETGGADYLNEFGVEMGLQTVQAPAGVKAVFGPEGTAYDSDFDKDGVSDAEEIIVNTDPRSTADTGICSDATYGCGAQVAPGGTPPFVSGWGLLAALGVAALLLRQRQRRA
jgi:MYXO-CTERM domain-containing protein